MARIPQRTRGNARRAGRPVRPSTTNRGGIALHRRLLAIRQRRKDKAQVNALYNCPFCRVSFRTKQRLLDHTNSDKHKDMMAQSEKSCRVKIASLQLAAHNEARSVNKKTGKEIQFCTTCMMQYTDTDEEHQNSANHKKIRNELYTYCKLCDYYYTTRFAYNKHRLTAQHMRNRAYFLIQNKLVDVTPWYPKEYNKFREVGLNYVVDKRVYYCEPCDKHFPCVEDGEDTFKSHCKSEEHFYKYKEFCEKKKKEEEERKLAEAKKEEEEDKKKEEEAKKKEEEDKKKEEEAKKKEEEAKKKEETKKKEEPKKKEEEPKKKEEEMKKKEEETKKKEEETKKKEEEPKKKEEETKKKEQEPKKEEQKKSDKVKKKDETKKSEEVKEDDKTKKSKVELDESLTTTEKDTDASVMDTSEEPKKVEVETVTKKETKKVKASPIKKATPAKRAKRVSK